LTRLTCTVYKFVLMTVFDVLKTRSDVNQIATIVESVYNGEFNLLLLLNHHFIIFTITFCALLLDP